VYVAVSRTQNLSGGSFAPQCSTGCTALNGINLKMYPSTSTLALPRRKNSKSLQSKSPPTESGASLIVGRDHPEIAVGKEDVGFEAAGFLVDDDLGDVIGRLAIPAGVAALRGPGGCLKHHDTRQGCQDDGQPYGSTHRWSPRGTPAAC
jgi:hypothetical protein